MGWSRWFSRLLRKRGLAQAPVPEAEERDYTLAELAELDGSDSDKPILIAIRGYVYDVTRGRDFYGPGGPYGVFAGRDCTRALARGSLEAKDLVGDLEGVGEEELNTLEEWIELFEGKYRRVGRLIDDQAPAAPHG